VGSPSGFDFCPGEAVWFHRSDGRIRWIGIFLSTCAAVFFTLYLLLTSVVFSGIYGSFLKTQFACSAVFNRSPKNHYIFLKGYNPAAGHRSKAIMPLLQS
jgi:hypothetical protein